MNSDPADRAFALYRRSGDLEALGALFDLVAPELLRVSAHLTRDVHVAEDLVQETFVAAMQARDSFDAERRVVPWLVGILTKRAALHHRRRARAIAPGDRPEVGPAMPPEVLVEREVSHALADAVHALPSPYREVVLGRLRNGQSTSEIAAALERAPGTVRVQLSRGLDLLRKALPIGLAGSCAESVDGRGLDAIKHSVLERARELGAPVVTSAGTASATSSWVVACVAATVVAVSVWLTSSEDTPDTLAVVERSLVEPSLAHGRVSPASIDPPAATAARRTVALDEASTTASAPDAPLAGWVLRGRVGGPVDPARTRINVRAVGGGIVWPETLVAPTHPGDDGTFELDLAPLFTYRPDLSLKPSELAVRADHAECAPIEARVDVPHEKRDAPPAGAGPWVFETTFALERAASVSGRVLDESGGAIAGARVALAPLERGLPSGDALDVVGTDARGGYRLRTNRDCAFAVVALARGLRPATQQIGLGRRESRVGVDLVLERGEHIAGVVQSKGAAVDAPLSIEAMRRAPGATSCRIASDHLNWEQGRFEWWTSLTAPVDDTGSFEITGLAPGAYELRLRGSTSPPLRFTSKSMAVEAPVDDVVFAVAWSRLDLAVASEGSALAGASCWLKPLPARWGGIGFRTDAHGRSSVLTDADAPYAIEVEADAHAPIARDIRTAPAGGTTSERFDLVLGRASLALRVAAPTDAVSKLSIGFVRLGADATRGARFWPAGQLAGVALTRTVELADGRCVLTDLPLGSFEVRIEVGERYGVLDSLWYHEPIVIDLAPGSEVERAVTLVPAGRVRVRLEDPQGVSRRCTIALLDERAERIPIQFVSRLADGSTFGHVWYLGDLGVAAPALSDPALPPGRYTFVAGPEGAVQQSFPIVVDANQITPLVIHLDGE